MSWSWPTFVEYVDSSGALIQVGDFASDDEARDYAVQEFGQDAVDDGEVAFVPAVEPPTGPWAWLL